MVGVVRPSFRYFTIHESLKNSTQTPDNTGYTQDGPSDFMLTSFHCICFIINLATKKENPILRARRPIFSILVGFLFLIVC